MASRSGAADELRRQAASLFGGGAVAGLGDGELIDRFLRRGAAGDLEAAEAAFGALVSRHGGMVLGVCRRALRNPHDAEDAFQAVFLILARKAGSVRVDDSIGRWLYGVSRKVAARARTRAKRLHAREVSSTAIDATEPPGRDSAEKAADRDDLRTVILDELARLPGRYREAIEACDLDGCSHEEAALRLGWPVGTVRSRLSRGRDRLRGRLERRGVGHPGLGVPVVRGLSGSMPPALASATTQAAVRFAMRRALDGSFPVAVATLTQEALRAMIISKLTVAVPAALLLAGGAVATAQFGGLGTGQGGPASGNSSPPAVGAQAGGGPGSLTNPPGSRPGAVAYGGGGFGGGFSQGIQTGGFGGLPGLGGSGYTGAGRRITLQAGTMILLESEAKDQITVHDAGSGKTANYQVPEGLTAVPIATNEVVVLQMEGEGISRLAAYGPGADSWSTIDLRPAVDGTLQTIVSGGMAAIWDGPRVYAFSARTSRWDVVERPEGAEGPPILNNEYVLCEDDDRVYVFGARTGRWAAVDPE
ncbi:RNA polymerase sigma factor [Tautonia plasticadhaerens]|uniref:ECF RNA polymerase sigma factor SigE n=1 Tax=Tautonia plasticadhaerens TaxID=2527974 RepID=A0A518H0A0_9BACT|nr:sigma-70 family RNA polymerase sigma factor [Tautonia plasticadhaerens]QDV34231.1 ECF RNA polymerase sigma factor SigE [Tautonia plasticadhaerens]